MIVYNEHSARSNGGTERVVRRVERDVDPALLEQCQIFPSRVRGELDPTKVRIYHAHDTAEDPESQRALGDGRWRRFHKVVFVSNWQMGEFIRLYGIDWDRCAVVRNAVDPVPTEGPWQTDLVRLIYTSTPQRGLDVLAAVFDEVSAEDPRVALDVFSSFGLYGWEEADKQFEPLFSRLRANPQVTVHGARPNEEVRAALTRAHVFAYPSTWAETSCLCLMEAMTAGLVCVHPNLGALYETAGALTQCYQWTPDKTAHAAVFKRELKRAIARVREMTTVDHGLVAYARRSFSWESRIAQWNELLSGLMNEPRELEEPSFIYRVG